MKDSTVKIFGFAIAYTLMSIKVYSLYGPDAAVAASLGILCVSLLVSANSSFQDEKREAAQKRDAK